jgi:AcrR family transcriptional regulator
VAGTRKAEQSEASRERLERAAADLFAQRGYRDASVQAIGEAAGISRGSIFWHFGSKEGLLFAVVDRVFREWETGGLLVDVGDAVGLEAVERALASHRRFLEEQRTALGLFYVLMFESLGPRPELRERFAALHEHLRDATEGFIVAGQERGEVRADVDARAVVTILIGALGGLAYQALLDRELDLDGAYAALSAVAVRGLSG